MPKPIEPLKPGDRITAFNRRDLQKSDTFYIIEKIEGGLVYATDGSVFKKCNVSYSPTLEQTWKRARAISGEVRNPHYERDPLQYE